MVDILDIVLYGFGAFELLIDLIGVPASAINFFLISRTSLLHPNLKHILLYQSGAIFIRGICRVVMCSLKFILLDPNGPENFEPWRFIFILCVYNRNFIGHILIIERLMATFATKCYEHKRSWLFTIIWTTLVFGISLYNMVVLGKGIATLPNLLTNMAMVLIGAVELVIFKRLWAYNAKVYKRHKMVNSNNTYSLSELYQLSENIRIGKQLMPTLFFHLLNVLTSSMVVFWGFFSLPSFPFVLVLVPTCNSFCSLMIEVTMITCHPFLKRDFTALINKLRQNAKPFGIGRNNTVESMERNDRRIGRMTMLATRDIISNEPMIIDDEMATQRPLERHFAMLEKFWRDEVK